MEWFWGYASGIILYMAISIMTTIPHLCCTRTHQTRTLSLLNITHSTTLSILNAHLSQRKWSTTSNYNTICWIKSYLESLNQTLLQRNPDFLHQNVWPRFFLVRMNFVFLKASQKGLEIFSFWEAYNNTNPNVTFPSLASFPPKSWNPNPRRVPLISSLCPDNHRGWTHTATHHLLCALTPWSQGPLYIQG
jgi:hypothetical protein